MNAWLLSNERFPALQPAANHLRQQWLLEQMKTRGFKPFLYSNGWSVIPRSTEEEAGARNVRLPGLGKKESRSPSEIAGVLGLALPWLLARCLIERPRLIVTQSPVFAPLLWLLTRLPGRRPFIHLDVIGLASREIEQQSPRSTLVLERLTWRLLERWAARSADLVTTVNEAHAAALLPWGVKAEILRDAAPAPLVPDALEGDVLLRELGLDSDDVVLLFVGSLVSRRLDDLFLSLEQVAALLPRLKVVIAGLGPDESRYRSWAKKKGLDRMVRFAGYQRNPALATLLVRADIAFSDCWSELGFPWKAFEYMAYGKAIVIEDKPQMHEVLGPDSALFYDSPQTLAERLVRLYGDAGLRRRLGRAAANLSAKESWGARAFQIDALWAPAVPVAATRAQGRQGR